MEDSQSKANLDDTDLEKHERRNITKKGGMKDIVRLKSFIIKLPN